MTLCRFGMVGKRLRAEKKNLTCVDKLVLLQRGTLLAGCCYIHWATTATANKSRETDMILASVTPHSGYDQAQARIQTFCALCTVFTCVVVEAVLLSSFPSKLRHERLVRIPKSGEQPRMMFGMALISHF